MMHAAMTEAAPREQIKSLVRIAPMYSAAAKTPMSDIHPDREPENHKAAKVIDSKVVLSFFVSANAIMADTAIRSWRAKKL